MDQDGQETADEHREQNPSHDLVITPDGWYCHSCPEYWAKPELIESSDLL
jgi:hypothetical protein